MHLTLKKQINHGHLFCGLGGGAKGFNRGKAKVGNLEAEFRCLGGIDVDPASCRDFKTQTGVEATCMDLFSRQQYRDFHGKEPSIDWIERTSEDIRRAFLYEHPHILFLSAPCKGFSGLLSEKMSATLKYQALNGLTLRGIWLALEAFKDDPVELIVFENVPRIATRGRHLLDQIVALLRAYGYAVSETTHDCGELGNLGQSRKRFLLVARFVEKIPTFLYEPVKHPLRGVGEILENLPVPGSAPGIGGPMHRMPSLQWKTWVRLAFVRAGADWRSLNELRVADGHLQDFGIVPDKDWHRTVLGVNHWLDTAGTITGNARSVTGAFNVADPREFREQDFHGLRVNEWRQHAGPITTQRSPGSSAQSVADPRVDGHEKSVQLGVGEWEQPAAVIKGDVSVGTGRYAVADPRIEGKRYNTTFRIVPWCDHAPAVHGPGGPGGLAVADPRPAQRDDYKQTKYRVTGMNESTGAVIGASSTGNGAYAVADPRYGNWHEGASSSKLRVTDWQGPARPITGSQQVASGAGAVADPRFEGRERATTFGVKRWEDDPANVVAGESYPSNGAFSVADPRVIDERGHYLGVKGWDQHSGALSGRCSPTNGAYSVADPRESQISASDCVEGWDILPAANDKLICTIRALDGTWHRPFTTLELAALQGLVDTDDPVSREVFGIGNDAEQGREYDRWLQLDGNSDSAWRERIGNMVPPPAAEAIAGVCGVTLLAAWSGQTFMMGSTPIWVRPVAVALMTAREFPSHPFDTSE